MKYIECRRCSARFHTGVIYESIDACSRCGAPLKRPRLRLRFQLGQILRRRRATDSVDWEAVTGSQYIRRHVIAKDRGHGGNSPSPA